MPVGPNLFEPFVEWCQVTELPWRHGLGFAMLHEHGSDRYMFFGTLTYIPTRIWGSNLVPPRFEGTGHSSNVPDPQWTSGSVDLAIILSRPTISVTASERLVGSDDPEAYDWIGEFEGYAETGDPDPTNNYFRIELPGGITPVLSGWPIREPLTMTVPRYTHTEVFAP